MRVFLIRHGETVDNVANLYAGSRDSELTNHGVQQATRLGQHFAASPVIFTHIFSSQLQRAVKTAEMVRVAQPEVRDDDGNAVVPLVAQVNDLAEQDFGSYEGVSFLARSPGSKASDKGAHRAVDKNDPDFVDMESKESMNRRVDVFLDEHLMPIVQAEAATSYAVAVVSHGITLSVLWRRLLHRLPPKSVTVHPEVLTKYGTIDLERLGGWSNTGYLELDIVYQAVTAPVTDTGSSTPINSPDAAHPPVTSTVLSQRVFAGWTVTVCAVNSRQHLIGLKRTGGGVGSARYDDKQKSIDTFFKRRKVG